MRNHSTHHINIALFITAIAKGTIIKRRIKLRGMQHIIPALDMRGLIPNL